jgi:ribosome-associated protein
MTSETTTTPDIAARVRVAVAAAEGRKALDLQVLDLDSVSDFTEYFVICSGSNERQVQAIADGVLEQLREVGTRPLHVEGQKEGSWILLDFGSLVVHVFHEDTRAFYALERLWSDATDVTGRLAG